MTVKIRNTDQIILPESSTTTSKGSVSRRGRSASADRAGLVRRDIFNRAMALFEKKGFRGTSMREIAESCKVSKPAIYHYFKNKSAFIKEIYNFMTAEFYEAMNGIAASDQEPRQKLEAIVHAQILYSISHQRFQRILVQDRRELDAPDRNALMEQEKRYEAMLADLVRTGQDKGHFHKADVELTVMSILGLLSSVHRWANAVKRPPDVIAQELTAFVMRSVLARAA